MLTDLDFAEKYTIFVLEKRREPQTLGFSPFFGLKNAKKKGCFTLDVENFTSESGFFFFESGFFLGVCGRNFADIENQKLKYIYFSGRIFNILSNYSGQSGEGFSGEICTAPCLQGVSMKFVLSGMETGNKYPEVSKVQYVT